MRYVVVTVLAGMMLAPFASAQKLELKLDAIAAKASDKAEVDLDGAILITDLDKILKFIRTTKTESGLTVSAYLIPENYDTGIKISDAEMRQLNLVPHDVLGRWNYTVRPTQHVN